MRPDADRVAAIIEEAVMAEMLPHYRRLDPGAVKTKESPTDLVTFVDEAMERILKKRLLELTPGAAFVGEEAAAADPEIARLVQTAERCWIVDPLDGTRNFVHGVDEFGTIIAYVENGETIGGLIYAAPERAMAVAMKGEGVFWNGERLFCEPQKDARPAGLRSTGWLKPEWKDRMVAALKNNVVSRPGHCSAYAYLKLLKGETDFKLSSRIHAWDHAAGALMLEEMGGEVRWLDSKTRYAPAISQDRPLLATGPGRDWRTVAELLLN